VGAATTRFLGAIDIVARLLDGLRQRLGKSRPSLTSVGSLSRYMLPDSSILPSIRCGCCVKYSLMADRLALVLTCSAVSFHAEPDGISPGFNLRNITMSVGDLGVCIALEGIVGESDCTNEVGPLREVFAQRRVLFVERAFGGDEQNQAARAYFLQRGGEEVIMDGKLEDVETRVERLIVPKRNVGNRHVVETIGQPGFLEWLVAMSASELKPLGEPGGEQVRFQCR